RWLPPDEEIHGGEPDKRYEDRHTEQGEDDSKSASGHALYYRRSAPRGARLDKCTRCTDGASEQRAPGAPEQPLQSASTALTTITRQLGAYDVLAPFGAGGMGEVYKARHSRLGRLVALKRRAFLHHPHIASLFFPAESSSANYFDVDACGRRFSDSKRGTRGAGAWRDELVQRAQTTSRIVAFIRPERRVRHDRPDTRVRLIYSVARPARKVHLRKWRNGRRASLRS